MSSINGTFSINNAPNKNSLSFSMAGKYAESVFSMVQKHRFLSANKELNKEKKEKEE